MEVPFDVFYKFLQENNDSLDMPSGEHPIRLDTLEAWRLRMREFTDEPKRNAYSLFADIFAKVIAVEPSLSSTGGYIPFNIYKAKLEQIAEEILAMESTYDDIYMYVPQELSRSNTWVGLLLFRTFADRILKDKLHIIFSAGGESGYTYLEERFKANPEKRILAFIVDDMSYSGTQLSFDIPSRVETYRSVDFYACVAFIGSAAVDVLRPLGLKFFTSTSVCPSIQNIVTRYKEERKVPFPDSPYAGNLESTYDELLKILGSISYNKKFYSALSVYKSQIPIYFDHKIADSLSTFTVILQFAPTPKANSNKSPCILESLITGCPNPTLHQAGNLCRGEKVRMDYECYKAYYKTIPYTYSGVIIDDTEKTFGDIVQSGGRHRHRRSRRRIKNRRRTRKTR